MRVECTQCNLLKNDRCLKGRNTNYKSCCRFKSPKFDILKIGNMPHITEEDYKFVRNALREAAENEETEVTIRLYDLDFVFDITDAKFNARQVPTGVEHMGEKEMVYESELESARCSFRGAFDDDDSPVETDFMEHKIAVI